MSTLRDLLGITGDPEQEAEIAAYRIEMEVAQMVYDLRTEAGLTQAQLAERIGTHASAISRLEDADYAGHSLPMLRRIAGALGRRVILAVAPLDPRDEADEPRELTPAA